VIRTLYLKTDWLKVLCPTQHKTGHFLAWYEKKTNLIQQKHTFTNQHKCTTTQNKQKNKARFSRLVRHPAWKWRGPIIISVLHKFVTYLLTTHHHHTHFMALFRDHPGQPVPDENFWTLWCTGRLTEADTPTIRLGATPIALTSAHLHNPPPIFYRLDGCPSFCQPTVSKHCHCLFLTYLDTNTLSYSPGTHSPFPQIDIMGTMVIVWKVRGNIIWSVLCNIVCNNCAQCDAHTYEQT